jgi:hypothetical protein
MLCKLIVVEDNDCVEDDWNLYVGYNYLEYYLCDIASKRAIIFKNCYATGMVGKNEGKFQLDANFDYKTIIENIKKASDENEEKYRDFEILSMPSDDDRDFPMARPPMFRLRRLEDVEVDKDFFESVFQHFADYQTEKRRFESKIRNLFDIE